MNENRVQHNQAATGRSRSEAHLIETGKVRPGRGDPQQASKLVLILFRARFQDPYPQSPSVDGRKLLEVFLVVIGHSREQVEGLSDNDIPQLLDELVRLECLS